MGPRDSTTDILVQIDERFDQIDQRFDQIDGRFELMAIHNDNMERQIEEVYDGLTRRLTDSEARVAIAISNLAGTLHHVEGLLRARLGRCKQPRD